MNGIGGAFYMGTILIVTFLTTAVFIPALKRGDRRQFGVCMVGTFLLIYIGSVGLEISTIRSLVIASLMTAVFGFASCIAVWFERRTERKRRAAEARSESE